MFAGVNTLPTNTKIPQNARLVGISKIELDGHEDVYNMEVDDNHNFAVNGGLIVHNCMDATRYMVMTKQITRVVNPYYSPIENRVV